MQPNQTDKTAVTHAGDHHYPVVNTEQSLEKETFQIKLPLFEGPFDLLLFFIERDELDIQEISISKITDDFLDYIRQMNALNIELASEFIYVASTLMQIKARMLIPRTAIDEQGNEIDPKQDLIQKLLEYKKIKVVAEQMRELETKRMQQEKRGNIAYDLSQASQFAEPGEELSTLNLYKLMLVYHKMMNKYHHRSLQVTHTVVQYPYTIEQQKKVITQLLEINQKIDFDMMMAHANNKVEFVYTFLAMLEMLQQELIAIQINLGFNNFSITSRV